MGLKSKFSNLQHEQPVLLFMLVYGACPPSSRVSYTCSYPGVQSWYRADQCGRTWCEQGPILSHGGEGGVREPVRALCRADVLDSEQGVLRYQACLRHSGKARL